MDLKTFKFPATSDLDIAFPTFGTIPELLAEAKERGFYDGNTPYNKMFSTLFFVGGAITYKKDLDPAFRQSASRYLRGFMGSFQPKHEEKEAICAMLLSELCVDPSEGQK